MNISLCGNIQAGDLPGFFPAKNVTYAIPLSHAEVLYISYYSYIIHIHSGI